MENSLLILFVIAVVVFVVVLRMLVLDLTRND